ncbi:hypothetical protein V8B97DRAFT_469435 [Scleroderma yunnanense]
MLFQRLVRLLRSLLQKLLAVSRKNPWTCFLPRLLSLFHQNFGARSRLSTQGNKPQRQLCGTTHASYVPPNIGSTSGNVESPSLTDMPYAVGYEDLHQKFPRPSVGSTSGPFSQGNTGCSRTTPAISLEIPVNPINGPRNLGPNRDHLSPSSSLHHLPGSPHTTNMLLSPRSPSVTSHQSGGSNRSVRSYRQHEGATPRVRSPHHYSVYSATGSATSLASPSVVVAQPDGKLVAIPGNDEGEYPLFAEMTSRQVSRIILAGRKPSVGDYKVPAMQLEYDYGKELPTGWKACRHPEGALFYMNSEMRTFTEVNIHDKDIHEDVEYFANFLWKELRHEIRERSLETSLNVNEVQLVVEPRTDNDTVLCCYYFVNPAGRSLFWLEEWDAPSIFSTCRGVDTLAHKGLAIQALYWEHWSLFPTLCRVTPKLKEDVKAMAAHALCDHLTSTLTSSPRNPEELKTLLSLLENMNSNPEDDEGHSASIFGRIMVIFYSNYYDNFHGEQCARLNFSQSVHGWKYHPSKRMKICAPLFFFSPITSVRHLHTIFVDGIASKERWNVFVNQLTSHLQDTNLLATVLLNGNVGFLGIHSVDSGNGVSLRQIVSYLSLIASFASIMLGLVFVRHSRTDSRNSVFAAAKFLGSLWDEKHGLETLAIIYSLPHTFLVWGMILFFIALSAEWWHPGNLVSWISIGMAMVIVFLVIGWCIWTARDRSQKLWFETDPDQVSFINGQPEDQDGCRGNVPSHPLRRVIHYISSLFNTRNGCGLDGNNNGLVEEIGMRPVSVAALTGGSLDGPEDDTRTDQQQRESANSRASSPVAINIRQPTLLPDSDVHTPLPCSSAGAVTPERREI